MNKENLYSYLNHSHVSKKTVCDAVCGELFSESDAGRLSRLLQNWSKSKSDTNRNAYESTILDEHDFERIWNNIEDTRFYTTKTETT